jgi:hypothetical protein
MKNFEQPHKHHQENKERQLNTEYTHISRELAAEHLLKIEPGMQHALNVCGQVFKDCKHPWCMIGSNALVLEADTGKKGKDLDVIFADQDFDIIENNFKKLEAAGQVSGLKITPMVNFENKPNGCLKISGFIKTGESSEEFEAFAQNIDPDKSPNGIINIGLDKHRVNIYQIPSLDGQEVEVNFLDKKGVEELYLKNLSNEFGLYKINGWLDKKFLNAKALQRLANLHNLGNSTEDILDKLDKLEKHSQPVIAAIDNIKTIWKEFKGLSKTGPGLVKSIGEENGFEDDRYRAEKATDIFTEKSTTDMERVTKFHSGAKEAYEAAKLSGNRKRHEEAIKEITNFQDDLIEMMDMYIAYQELTDNSKEEDFCIYAALPHLIEHFMLPVSRQLSNYKIMLEDNSKNLKE